jgi:3-hydroxyacyl-[acyl-carrier-protein] dehydratase
LAAEPKAPDLEALFRLLPHRYPFLLIDRVLEIDPDRVITLKNVTIDEPFFAGHFPNRPLLPGVLIVEAMAQSAAILALSLLERPKLFVLTGIDKVRLRRRVIPGDQLRIEVRLLKRHRPLWKMRCEASVDGGLAAEGELSAMEVEEEQ